MSEPRARTLRAFIALGLGIVLSLVVGLGLDRAHEIGARAWPIRKVLELNARIWHVLQSESRRANPQSPLPPAGTQPRVNGLIGLSKPIDISEWRLEVASPALKEGLQLTLAELKAMPKSEETIEFRCVEGWSDSRSYAGVRFEEFMRWLGVGRQSGKPWPGDGSVPDDLYAYAAFETPDRGYYVSADMKSLLHPQTLLAWEMNGALLLPDNGAPLRLKFSIKYGYKSLKRIGRIYFSDARPPDYWAERGYDWFAGL